MAKDIEQAIEEVKGKGFKVSINNIIAIVTFLSTVIAGWYSFTGRIDGLEEVVTGFADASDIELVTEKFNSYDVIFLKYDEELKYLRDKVDKLKNPKVKSYDGDIINLENKIDKLQNEIKRLEKLLKDPLADFK
jgi:peptidoglycan hydrolase CwlO-like protein|tara:strand:+ start:5240 stop:5641 length:402 start_codon:yes stop_codon:yes gene_type:complete